MQGLKNISLLSFTLDKSPILNASSNLVFMTKYSLHFNVWFPPPAHFLLLNKIYIQNASCGCLDIISILFFHLWYHLCSSLHKKNLSAHEKLEKVTHFIVAPGSHLPNNQAVNSSQMCPGLILNSLPIMTSVKSTQLKIYDTMNEWKIYEQYMIAYINIWSFNFVADLLKISATIYPVGQ